ncbi:MAG: DUF2218 domain-containing protein [Sphingobium sp.]|mgnify:FL=1|nr:DUF2218 domain-containing protein [Sphingobium sp.]MBP6111024.1 DUF2218 domain-containing protein [Sphingobium sp.]MBP8670208.1 DUF2218 domain-containing protein [Sphingobium sp.]MBP9157242.1 DUF2218 domain-containing protein [Sphingobium sp.]MCC6481902.1 DUF2218 domain-containing protein [Sphingomonadaceae bacterium]
MTIISNGTAATSQGDKYIRQLIKHWGHKFETSYEEGVGTVPFAPDAIARLTSDAASLRIELQTPDAEGATALRGVIERHVDRFAFREAPLSYAWEPLL